MIDIRTQTKNTQSGLPHPGGHANAVPDAGGNIGDGFASTSDPGQTQGNAASLQRDAEQKAGGYAADSLPNAIANPMPVAQ